MISWDIIRNNFSLILYGVALILSLFRYRKFFDSLLKYFPIIIGYTLFTEVLGMLINRNEDFAVVFSEGYSYYNSLIFNIFDILFYLYFFYVYWHVLQNKKYKKWIKNGSIIFVIVSLINPFFQDFYLTPQICSMIAGSTILTFSAILYLNQLKNQKLKRSFNLLFWISVGILSLYPFLPVIFSIILFLDDYWYHTLHINSIHQFLICLMYTCFIIGFLKMRRFKFA